MDFMDLFKSQKYNNCFQIEDGVLVKYTEDTGVTKVVVPDGVTSIGKEAFKECKGLREVILPVGLTSIGESAFYSCSKLSNIIFPAGITSIERWAFIGCVSLTEITIPEGVTRIGFRAFSLCKNLRKVVIPKSVTRIESGAFDYCTSLTGLVIPEGITTIEEWTCGHCESLTEVVIPKSVTSIERMAFLNCKKWFETYPGKMVIENNILIHYKGNDERIIIPWGIKSIAESAFCECTDLTEILIPEGVTYPGTNNCWEDAGFYVCSNLKKLILYSDKISITLDISGIEDKKRTETISKILKMLNEKDFSVVLESGLKY